METFFKATSPDDRWVIQVLMDGEERFECSVTLDGKHIVEELETGDRDKMFRWTMKQMKEVSRRVKTA